MNLKSFISTIAIPVLLAPGSLRAEAKCYGVFFPLADMVAAQQPNPAPSPKPSASRDSALYAEGSSAIDAGRWSDAEAIFTKVADMHGENAEGALYWKAYAQNKQGQPARALETCAELRRMHPKSRWIGDCGALEIEIRGKGPNPVQPGQEQDDELKAYALLAVMQQDEARALPIIQQILTSNTSSEKLKERALFVLTQSKSPQAQDILNQVARGQSNPALQLKAIHMLGAMRGKQSADTFADIYKHTSDDRVKKAILQSYLVSGNPDKLVEAARTEQNPDLVRTAVHTLGAMGATSQLLDLYRSASNEQVKSSIIEAFVASGHKGADALSTIATSEQNPELRRKAIRNLGITGGQSAFPAIVSTYQSSNDVETKKAAIDALFIGRDAHDLVALARAEKDPALKKEIVSRLSTMHDKEATDYLIDFLNK